MSLSDPIGDMIARVKNAQDRNHKKVELPSSNFKIRIADILKNEGFIKEFKVTKFDYISLSGQTIFHNPVKKISIQLGNAKRVSNTFKTNVISNFREKDIKNGGQGAPIGAYYHKLLLEKINKKARNITPKACV